LDELWRDWRTGLATLKKKGADPLYDRLENLSTELMDLELMETELWEKSNLSGPLDSVALRQHCEASICAEISCDDGTGKQKHEWLQILDRLHRLRKEKTDILTDLTEQYGSNFRPLTSPQRNKTSNQVRQVLHTDINRDEECHLRRIHPSAQTYGPF
jgi:hypothetical protein